MGSGEGDRATLLLLINFSVKINAFSTSSLLSTEIFLPFSLSFSEPRQLPRKPTPISETQMKHLDVIASEWFHISNSPNVQEATRLGMWGDAKQARPLPVYHEGFHVCRKEFKAS